MREKDRSKWLAAAAGGAAGGLVASLLVRRARSFSYRGKSVIITGGSRGLGLALARQLVPAGARITLCSRSEAQLAAAEQQLRRLGGSDILTVRADLQGAHDIESLVAQAESRWGGVDVLINNAGVIQVGPFDSMTFEDFERAMAIHCWGALRMIQAVLPGMRRRGFGRIVNIASIGGKIAVPHLLPYTVSKFALVGLSEGLRAELAKERILVTTVCPGMMRTGSPRNALFKGRHREEYAWFSISDSLPFISMDVEHAAAEILRACWRGDAEAVLGFPARLGAAVHGVMPGLTMELLALVDRFLPAMGGIGAKAVPGHQSGSEAAPSRFTRLSDEAAARNNEFL